MNTKPRQTIVNAWAKKLVKEVPKELLANAKHNLEQGWQTMDAHTATRRFRDVDEFVKRCSSLLP